MKRLLGYLGSILIVFSLCACEYYETLDGSLSSDLFDLTTQVARRQIDASVSIPYSIDYYNSQSDMSERIIKNDDKVEYSFQSPAFNLVVKDGFAYKEEDMGIFRKRKTKKECDADKIALLNLITSEELAHIIQQGLTQDAITSYNGEKNRQAYNLYIHLDCNKIKKLIDFSIPVESIELHPKFVQNQNEYELSSFGINFVLSRYETLNYILYNDASIPLPEDSHKYIYDAQLTFELPKHNS